MGYFKKKIILTLLGILILIALFSCVSYFTFAFTFSHNNKPKFTSAIDYYVFDEEDDYFGPINNLGKYDDYSYFRIDNKEGLMAFQKSVNNGWNFDGKEVDLNSNIDFEGGEFDGVGDQHLESGLAKFEGVFDGQGFTVSNYKSNVTNTTSNNQVRGFFNEIQNGAEVKNLRIKDVTYSVSYSSTKKFVGGVVGQVTDYGSDGVSKINNCVVENLTIIGTSALNWNNNYGFGGIIGHAENLEISNSYVTSFNTDTVEFIYSGNKTSSGGMCGATDSASYLNIKNSIFKSSNSYLVDSNGTTNIEKLVGVTTVNGNEVTVENSYLQTNQTEGLDLTNTWYYDVNYNDGYPYLRSFLSFFYFDCDGDGNYEKVRPIESDMSNTLINSMSSVVQYRDRTIYLTYYGWSENVSPSELTGQVFRVWRKDSDYEYTATFSPASIYIYFSSCSNATLTNNNAIVSSVEDNIYYGENIRVTLSRLNKDGTYDVITFRFINTSGVEKSIVYSAADLYFFEGYRIGTNPQTEESITITGETYIYLTSKLKTYIPEYE